MLYRVTHVTRSLYDAPASQCVSEARVTPRSLPSQRVRDLNIRVEPEPAVFERHKDYFGNDVSAFTVLGAHDRFVTTATSVVEVLPTVIGALPRVSWEETRDALVSHATEDSLQAYEFI